ncbi:MAG: hypothetical protein NWE89_04070 [Candidatus Bathyarchaeota archaeon]|nr:hypothetical protein [Candidatus Bathyarchaeota archaeon]
MNTKSKTILMLAIIMASTLAVTMTPISAETEGDPEAPEQFFNRGQQIQRFKEALKNKLQNRVQSQEFAPPEEIELEDLDEDDVEGMIADVENAAETAQVYGKVWIVRLHGESWSITSSEDTVDDDSMPLGMLLAVKKIKVTEYGTLYEVLRGAVGHDGERVIVEGFAVLKDGVFAMMLTGEDFDLKGIGRIAPARVGVRVGMKGFMSHDGKQYHFKVTGRAHPIRSIWRWRKNQNEAAPGDLSPTAKPQTVPRNTPNASPF